jgi:hypothetical protein
MLEKLDSISWSKLEHAYGPAGDTPGLIRGLASKSSEIREQAYDKICFTIYHQGSIYEAAIYSVPFLVELLESPDVLDKHNILYLLYLLSCGGSWHANHYDLMPLMKDRRDTPEYQKKMRIEKEWVARLKCVLNEESKTYFKLLNSPEQRVRSNAIHLLLSLPEQKEKLPDEFRKRLDLETDEAVRAYLYFGMGSLSSDNSAISFLDSAFETETSPISKLSIAMQLVAKPAKNAVAATQLLSDTLLAAEPELIKRYSIPDRDLISDIATTLVLAGREAVDRVLPDFIEYVRANRYESRCWALLFMAMCSEGKPKRPVVAKELSELQQRAIMTAAETAWYPPRTTNVNALDLLRSFGLPDGPAEMDKLLGLPHAGHSGFAALFLPLPPKKPWWKIW